MPREFSVSQRVSVCSSAYGSCGKWGHDNNFPVTKSFPGRRSSPPPRRTHLLQWRPNNNDDNVAFESPDPPPLNVRGNIFDSNDGANVSRKPSYPIRGTLYSLRFRSFQQKPSASPIDINLFCRSWRR